MATPEVVWRALQDLRHYAIDSIKITGGEPFINPDLPEIVQTAAEFAPVSITTNGSLLSRHLSRIDPSVPITVSLYGTTSREYSHYTQKAPDVFVTMLREVTEALRLNADRFSANIMIRSDPTWSLDSFSRFSQDLGFRKVRYLTLLGPNRNTPEYRANSRRVAEFFQSHQAKVLDASPTILACAVSGVQFELVRQYEEFGPSELRCPFVWVAPNGRIYETKCEHVFEAEGFLVRKEVPET